MQKVISASPGEQPVIRLMKPSMQVKNLNCASLEMGTGNYSVLDMDWDKGWERASQQSVWILQLIWENIVWGISNTFWEFYHNFYVENPLKYDSSKSISDFIISRIWEFYNFLWAFSFLLERLKHQVVQKVRERRRPICKTHFFLQLTSNVK